MPRRLLSVAAAGALLLGLAACGEPNDGPVTTPPPDIGISDPSDGGGDTEPSDGGGEQTESPTAGAPDIPPPDPSDYAGMDENTPEGAEQAFRYYVDLLFWGYQTGSAEATIKMSGPTCDGCREITSQIDDIRSNGTYWGDTQVSAYGSETYGSENYDYEIGYIYIVGEHAEPSAGGQTTEVPEKAYSAIAGMSWNDGYWTVGGLSIEETDSDL